MFQWIVISWIALAIGVFIYLLFRPAPYGRYAEKGWGPLLSSRVAWILMETPVFIIVLVYGIKHYDSINLSNSILIGLFLLHYFNRCFIYPFRLKSIQNKMPLTIVLSAVFFNLMNGNILGYDFTSGRSVIQFDTLYYVGIGLFFLGMVINVTSDTVLIRLRKDSKQYSIPEGFMYNYISCPNYFGEIVEWAGFALAAGNLGALSFLIWTCANLVPRALSNHKWYQGRFPQYPNERKAVIPFIL